jgi:hypothetical protein
MDAALCSQGVRQVSTSEEEALKVAATFLRRAGQRANAKEVYQKLGDIASLMEVRPPPLLSLVSPFLFSATCCFTTLRALWLEPTGAHPTLCS